MSELMGRALVGFAAGLALAWWAWSWQEWRRHVRLSNRLIHVLGLPRAKRNRLFIEIRRRLNARQWRREIPDFFELLALAQSAGLNLPGAWVFAAESMKTSALAPMVLAVDAAVRSGQSWENALDAFDREINDSRCEWIVGLLRQGLRRGTPVADVLMDHVSQWHQHDVMEAERRAQTLSLKLLIPIFLFLLPAVFLVLFAPLLLRFSKGIPIF